MKHIAYFVFVTLIALNAHAGDIPPPATHATTDPVTDPQLVEQTALQSYVLNHEARIADPLYVTELPQVTEVQSKPFAVPAGWQMLEVSHPDKIVCSSYPQPSTWELVQIVQPVQIQPVTVGQSNVDSITIITEGE